MPLFSRDALNPDVRPREVFGWAMFDFANQGYTTVVITAVFNAYFVSVIAGNAPWATLAWTLALAASSAIVMLLMPVMGAYADARAAKKRLLLFSTAVCIGGTVALAFAGPGDVAFAVVAVIVSAAAYNVGESLIAAFLPELARREALGRVSGWGWSFGYLGGMLTLGLSLAYVLWASAQGRPATEFVPVTLVLTAVIFGLSAIPTFVLMRERAVPVALDPAARAVSSWQRLARTWREARRYKDFVYLMACAVSYQAGLAAVITLAAVYANQVLGFEQTDTMILIFLVNIAAMAGAFAFGYWQDRLGHKLALGITLVGWILMTVVAMLATDRPTFWVAAVLAGLCLGSSQSAGRALAGLFAPPARLAEFYGLWTFAVRLAAILGPVTYGLVTWLTLGNHRLAILSTGLFFLLGLLLLAPINVERGRQAALAAST